MNDREQRGLQIAAVCRIDQKDDGTWSVPSQSGKGRYIVCPDATNPTCTCADHETRGVKCKHIFAVEFARNRWESADGKKAVTTHTVTIKEEKRPTYRQVWPAYNKAQTNEKSKFRMLLHDLCQGIHEEPQTGRGRPRISLRDSIFAAAYKVYSTISGRRFMTDLREAQAAGHIDRAPSYNSIFVCLESDAVTPILKDLIAQSALPLKAVEVDFACDSSGFTSSRFHRWFDHKYGKERQEHDWAKVHIVCGVKTNIVTAAEALGRNAQDCPLLPGMVETTAKNFSVREVSGDKAYASFKNYDAIQAAGGTPFIPFKTHQGFGGKHGLWSQMYHYFMFRREEFLDHYHKRSNAESTFSMVKAKFGDSVRSRTETAMRNEALCKILCHNICCVIQEMYELGIEPEFWRGTEQAEKIG